MEERKKILFVVYRTEWWGCFDSYCRQECLDEDVVCYVMPVPRYEREDATLQVNFDKKHFDPEKLAAILPEGACMVDHERFSLEQGFERIYIHNPYDNGSPLDTVELKYYASNLKHQTKRLIYVSHLLGFLPPGYARYAAYDYVDAIYVANEGMKYGLETRYDEKAEIVPSGIPEYLDRLGERMQKQCSEGRMKLLYCVAFDDLLYGSEMQLKKMQDIFEYAKKNSELLLIFRPDEDIWVRRRELNGSVWEGYNKLVAFFLKNKIGIYDGTPDLYEAAALADGILCTSHPMAALFSVQGKYVLCADRVKRLIPTKEDRLIPILWALTAEEKGEEVELWFVPERTRLICRMTVPGVAAEGRRSGGSRKMKRRLAGFHVEIVAEIPDEVIGGLSYINITKAGNCIYLSPYISDGIWKYDMGDQSFSKQYLSDPVPASVSMTFVHGKHLYMVPRMYPGILKYDMEKEEIEIIDGWVEELERYVADENKADPYFIWAVKQEGSMLCMASSKCDVWMELDMDSDAWSIHPMGLSGKRFVNMVKDGEWVWLFPFCGDEITLWNRRTGESRRVCGTVRNEIKNTPYNVCLDLGDFMAAFPQQKTDHALVIRKTVPPTEGPIPVEEVRGDLPCGPHGYLTEFQKQRNTGYQFVKLLESGLILAYEYYDGSFLLLDKKLQVRRRIPCRLPMEAVRQQEDLVWRNQQSQSRFSGGLSEGYGLPAMMEYFVRHGRKDRAEIRKHHERYYLHNAGTGPKADQPGANVPGEHGNCGMKTN